MPRHDRPTQAALGAWQAYLRSHRAVVARLDRDLLERHGLRLDWYDVLVQLNEVGGETTMGALASRLLIGGSSCTRVVARMEVAGLVERRVDAEDGRVRHVRITRSGQARLRAAAATHLAGIQRHFGSQVSHTDATRMSELFAAVQRSSADGASGDPV